MRSAVEGSCLGRPCPGGRAVAPWTVAPPGTAVCGRVQRWGVFRRGRFLRDLGLGCGWAQLGRIVIRLVWWLRRLGAGSASG